VAAQALRLQWSEGYGQLPVAHADALQETFTVTSQLVQVVQALSVHIVNLRSAFCPQPEALSEPEPNPPDSHALDPSRFT